LSQIPIPHQILTGIQGIQQTRDNGFVARFIFIETTSLAELESRVRKRGDLSDSEIEGRLKIAKDEIEQSKLEGAYDQIFVNDNLDETFEKLDAYLFEAKAHLKEGSNGSSKDVEMADGVGPEANIATPAPEGDQS
jgi:guanylate kinase